MSNEHNKRFKERPDKDEVERCVAELYALADLIHSEGSDAFGNEQQRKQWEQLSLNRLLEESGSGFTMTAETEKHWWLIDALEDLISYARNERLLDLIQHLRDAQLHVQGTRKSGDVDQELSASRTR